MVIPRACSSSLLSMYLAGGGGVARQQGLGTAGGSGACHSEQQQQQQQRQQQRGRAGLEEEMSLALMCLVGCAFNAAKAQHHARGRLVGLCLPQASSAGQHPPDLPRQLGVDEAIGGDQMVAQRCLAVIHVSQHTHIADPVLQVAGRRRAEAGMECASAGCTGQATAARTALASGSCGLLGCSMNEC